MDEEEDLNCNEDIDHYPIWDMDNDVDTYVDADVDADEETFEPLETIMEVVNGSTAIMEDIELEAEADFEETHEGTALLQQQQQEGPQPHSPHPQEVGHVSGTLPTTAATSVSRSDLNQQTVIEQSRNNRTSRHYSRTKELHSKGSSDSG